MNKGILYLHIAISTIALYSGAMQAQENALETIVVIGDQPTTPSSKLVGSLDILTNDELTYEHVDDTLELFSKVPGVYLSRYNQGIINTDVAIRGFAGDGVSPHAKLLIDGIPSNLHNGYGELDQLFPLSIASLSVFKGTSDPRYGLFNIAGNYNVATRQDLAKEIELTVGSFNTQEAQAYLGSETGKLKHSYALGYRSGEGYRDHTDLTKFAASGSWQWDLSADQQFRLIARVSSYDGDAPGYLSEEEARRDPQQSASYAGQDGGEKDTQHLSAHWQQAFSEQLAWTFRSYWQSFERERWVRFSEGGSLQDRYDDQSQIGFVSTLNWYLSDSWELEWGADYETQDNLEQRFATLSNDTRTRNSAVDPLRDRQYDFTSSGTYAKLLHEPSEALRWNIALRADRLSGDYRDRNSGQSRDIYDYGTIVQPKFNIVYALSESANIFANAGRSFQHPIGAEIYKNPAVAERDVSVNDGFELGGQWSSDNITARLSYWQQKAKDEFVTIDGNSQNVGETQRDGFDLAFNGDISEDWSYWGSYTLVNSEIVKADQALGDVKGNELRSIPDYTASLGINYQVMDRLITRLHLDAQGDYYVNEANAQGQYGDYTVLSFSADYQASWGAVKVQIHNLTDESFAYVYDFSTDGSGPIIHSPGDGVNGSVSLSFEF